MTQHLEGEVGFEPTIFFFFFFFAVIVLTSSSGINIALHTIWSVLAEVPFRIYPLFIVFTHCDQLELETSQCLINN